MVPRNFVEEKMGSKFVEGRSVEFSKSYEESSPSTPIFFILSPGVDPLKDVEALGECSGHAGDATQDTWEDSQEGRHTDHTDHCGHHSCPGACDLGDAPLGGTDTDARIEAVGGDRLR